ncbi:FMRFamide receptor-like [Lineus longissimus]|uniref:FMRFamide receptor-like n=1 Tax=Lineus longissimus TaxID=88925 RepID=UPI00315CE133
MNTTSTAVEAILAIETTSQTNTCLYNPVYPTDGAGMVRFVFVVPVWLVVALLGLIGNTLAYLVLRRELRPSSTSYLLKTLAVVDNLVLVTFILDDSLVRIYISTGTLESYYVFYMIAHPFIWPFKWFIKTLSVYTIILVTAERYIAVCKPLQAASCCTIKKARIAFLAVCLFSLLYNLPKCWQLETIYRVDACTGRSRPFFIKRDSFASDFFWDTIYGVALYIVFLFAVPFLVLTVLNLFLIRKLRGGASCDFQLTGYTDKRLRLSKMMTKRIVVIVSVFLILELPAMEY